MNKTPLSQFIATCIADHVPYRTAVDEFRRAWIEEALKRNGKNQCMVAEEIGLHRNTVSRLIKSLHVQIPDGRKKMRDHARTTC